jgi:hypothetical protein
MLAMIDKIIHSFDEIKCKSLFNGFVFMHWTEKETIKVIEKDYTESIKYLENINPFLKQDFLKFKILHRYGGIFINKNLNINKNFYEELQDEKISILEKYQDDQLFIDDSLIACQNNHNYLNLFINKLIQNSLYEDIDKNNYKEYGASKIIKEVFNDNKKDFGVLPHYKFNVSKSELKIFNKNEIYIINES